MAVTLRKHTPVLTRNHRWPELRTALRDTTHGSLHSVELRGAVARQHHGPSFSRAFVAGYRQAGDTAPLASH